MNHLCALANDSNLAEKLMIWIDNHYFSAILWRRWSINSTYSQGGKTYWKQVTSRWHADVFTVSLSNGHWHWKRRVCQVELGWLEKTVRGLKLQMRWLVSPMLIEKALYTFLRSEIPSHLHWRSMVRSYFPKARVWLASCFPCLFWLSDSAKRHEFKCQGGALESEL